MYSHKNITYKPKPRPTPPYRFVAIKVAIVAIKRGVRASSVRDLVDRFHCCLFPFVSCCYRADCCAQTRARVEPVSYRREVRCGVSKFGFRPLMLDSARLGNRKSATTRDVQLKVIRSNLTELLDPLQHFTHVTMQVFVPHYLKQHNCAAVYQVPSYYY